MGIQTLIGKNDNAGANQDDVKQRISNISVRIHLDVGVKIDNHDNSNNEPFDNAPHVAVTGLLT